MPHYPESSRLPAPPRPSRASPIAAWLPPVLELVFSVVTGEIKHMEIIRANGNGDQRLPLTAPRSPLSVARHPLDLTLAGPIDTASSSPFASHALGILSPSSFTPYYPVTSPLLAPPAPRSPLGNTSQPPLLSLPHLRRLGRLVRLF